MKNHTKVYMEFFGFDEASFIPCEICGNKGNDLHHIKARGMGGNPSGDKDVIENIMCCCRSCHERYGDYKELRETLYKIHKAYMRINGKNITNL